MKFKIHVRTTEGIKLHDFAGSTAVFGRGSTVNIKVAVEGISREHFKIELKEDVLWLSDLKSSNGTVYKNKKIPANTPIRYETGEKIQVPGVKLQIWLESTSEAKNVVELPVKPAVKTKPLPKPVQAKEVSRIHDIASMIDVENQKEEFKVMTARQEQELTEIRNEKFSQIERECQTKISDNEKIAQKVLEDARQASASILAEARREEVGIEEAKQDLVKQKNDWEIELQKRKNEFDEHYAKKEESFQKSMMQERNRFKMELEQEKKNILLDAKSKAEELIDRKKQEEIPKIEAKVREEQEKIDEKIKQIQSWQKSTQDEIHALKMKGIKEAQKLLDEAQHQAQLLHEKAHKNAMQYDVDAKDKAQLVLRQKELEAKEILRDSENKQRLAMKEIEMERQHAKSEKERELHRLQEEIIQSRRECEHLKRSAQDEADAIIASALHSKELIGNDQFSNENLSGVFLGKDELTQSRRHLEQEWTGLLEKEYTQNKENILHKITLEAKEESLLITTQAQHKASQITNEAFRQAGQIIAQGQKKYEQLVADEEQKLSQLRSLNSQIQIDYNTVEKNVVQLKSDHVQLVADKTRLRRDLEDMSQELAMHSSHLIKLNNTLEETTQKFELEKKQLADDVQNLMQEKIVKQQELTDTIFELKNSINILSGELAPLQIDRQNVQSELDRLRSEHHSVYERYQILLVKDEEKTSRVHELTLQMGELNGQVEMQRSNLEQLTGTIAQAQEEWQKLLQDKTQVELETDHKLKKTQEECTLLKDTTRKECELSKKKTLDELKILQQEVALIKADKEQYALREISQMKEKSKQDTLLVAREAKRQADELVDKARVDGQMIIQEAQKKAGHFAQEMINQNKQLVDKVEMRRQELISLEQTMIDVREAKIKEASQLAAKFLAEKQKEHEIELNKLRAGWKEESDKEQLKRLQIIKNGQEEAQVHIQKGKEKALQIEAQAKQVKEENIILKRKMEQEAQNFVKEEVEKLQREMEQQRELVARELSLRKVKELEAINQLVHQEERRIEKDRSQHINDISHNLDTALRLRLKQILPENQDQVLGGLREIIVSVTREVLYPKNDVNKSIGVLVGSGKVASSVKMFWLKVGMAAGFPVVLLIMHLVFPGIYGGIKTTFLTAISPQKSASDNYMEREMEKRRNRPKFDPPKEDALRNSFSESLLYSRQYREFATDLEFEKRWTLALNKYLVEDLGQSENLVVQIMGAETAIHQTLLPLSENINPDYVADGIIRLKEMEADQYNKLKSYFSNEDLFHKYWAFKNDFYKTQLPELQRQPAQNETSAEPVETK